MELQTDAPSVSTMKTEDEIRKQLEQKALQSAEITRKESQMRLESDEAQLEIVTQDVTNEAKSAAYDNDTYRKAFRLTGETLREADLARLYENPESDVIVLVIAVDNARIEPNDRKGQAAIVQKIKEAFPDEFNVKNRWRVASLSVKHDTLNPQLVISRDGKGGLIPTFFTLVQNAHTYRAQNVFPYKFRSPERPNRIIQPRYPYKPGLYSDPEIS